MSISHLAGTLFPGARWSGKSRRTALPFRRGALPRRDVDGEAGSAHCRQCSHRRRLCWTPGGRSQPRTGNGSRQRPWRRMPRHSPRHHLPTARDLSAARTGRPCGIPPRPPTREQAISFPGWEPWSSSWHRGSHRVGHRQPGALLRAPAACPPIPACPGGGSPRKRSDLAELNSP